MVVASAQAADAYAEVIAKTIVHYNEHVCSCCLGNSAAYATVGADVQVRPQHAHILHGVRTR